jgi:uncharacterized protein involved in exopolysaccharide biosynthesis
LSQQIQLDSELKKASNRAKQLERTAAAYREQLGRLEEDPERYTPTDRDNIVVEAKKRLLDLELQLQQLLNKDFREDGRLVSNVRREIALVEKFLRAQEADIHSRLQKGNPVYQEVETELLRTEADLASENASVALLAKQLDNLSDEIRALDGNEKRFRALQRAVEVNESNYLTYVAQREEARISDELDRQKIANISVVQVPFASPSPVAPNRWLNIGLGLLFGALVALTGGFLSELSSQRSSTTDQVEEWLHVPVLASIDREE